MAARTAISRWRLGLSGLKKHGTYLMFGGQLTYGQDGAGGDEHLVMLTGGKVADVLGYRAWADWVVPWHIDLRLGVQLDSVIRDLDTDGIDAVIAGRSAAVWASVWPWYSPDKTQKAPRMLRPG